MCELQKKITIYKFFLFFSFMLQMHICFYKFIIYFIRCQDVHVRREYVDLVDSVRDSGGEVKIFSSMHVSGERKYI